MNSCLFFVSAQVVMDENFPFMQNAASALMEWEILKYPSFMNLYWLLDGTTARIPSVVLTFQVQTMQR